MTCRASAAYLVIIALVLWPLKLAISSSSQPAHARSRTPRLRRPCWSKDFAMPRRARSFRMTCSSPFQVSGLPRSVVRIRLMDHDHRSRMQNDILRRDRRQGGSISSDALDTNRHRTVPLDLGHKRCAFSLGQDVRRCTCPHRADGSDSLCRPLARVDRWIAAKERSSSSAGRQLSGCCASCPERPNISTAADPSASPVATQPIAPTPEWFAPRQLPSDWGEQHRIIAPL